MIFFIIMGCLFSLVGLVALFIEPLIGIGLMLFGIGSLVLVHLDSYGTANTLIVQRLTEIWNELERIKWERGKSN